MRSGLLQKPWNIGNLVLAVGINLQRVSITRFGYESSTRKQRTPHQYAIEAYRGVRS